MAQTTTRSAATQSESDHTTSATVSTGYVRDYFIAGTAFFIVGMVALMGIITAEAFYPGYNAGVQEISDLGATRPPNSVIMQPSATIFNATMIVSGLLVLGATVLLFRRLDDRIVSLVLGLFGLGVLGVGIFDGSEVPWHGLFALLTFVSGGLAAIVAYRVIETPFRYLSVAVGVFVLSVLVSFIALGETHPMMALGLGGVERYVVYPVLVWVIGFGGYLMGSARDRAIAG